MSAERCGHLGAWDAWGTHPPPMRAVGLGRPPPAVPATARAEPAGTGGTRQHGRCGRTVSVRQAEWSTRRRRASLRSDRRCWSPVPSFPTGRWAAHAVG